MDERVGRLDRVIDRPDRPALTKTEPSEQTDSGLSALLLCVSSAPEQEPLARFPASDEPEVLRPRGTLRVLDHATP